MDGLNVGLSSYLIGVVVVCSFNGMELLRFVGCLKESPAQLKRDHFIFVPVEDEKRNTDL
jgi:hypothetical protein